MCSRCRKLYQGQGNNKNTIGGKSENKAALFGDE